MPYLRFDRIYIRPAKGEIVCAKCGYVIEENVVDEGPEWRAFEPGQREKRARTGRP